MVTLSLTNTNAAVLLNAVEFQLKELTALVKYNRRCKQSDRVKDYLQILETRKQQLLDLSIILEARIL